MYTKNYHFTTINAVKIIVQNSKNEILLVQEPEDNDWMPLHWGLPGGKPTEKESLLETFHRKAKTDVGQNLKLEGVLRVEELLMEGKTVMMYIVLAKTISDEVNGEAKEYKWASKQEVEKMGETDFTEYYNKELLAEFFEGKLKLAPIEIFRTWNYFEMGGQKGYKRWFKSGKKE